MTEPRFKDLPPRIAKLPTDERGYPVPYFVEWIDGKPDFRVMSSKNLARAVNYRRCWICGEQLGRFLCFAIGPMCGVNRISAEPPSHYDCARFAVSACPFLSKPLAKRNDRNLPNGKTVAGIMIERNPGVTLLWVTKSYHVMNEPDGVLFRIGEPERVQFFREGRLATRAEVDHSIATGIDNLDRLAQREGAKAVNELEKCKQRLTALLDQLLPAHAAAF